MATRRLWLLNLDADCELAAPLGYTPDRRTLAGVDRFAPLARALLGPEDVALTPSEASHYPKGHQFRAFQGEAWCPTPSALRWFRRLGAAPPVAPSLATLQASNRSDLPSTLGQGLEGVLFSRDQDAILAQISCEPRHWMLKRAFGFAGRGLRRVRGELTPDDRRWIQAGCAGAGILVEPLVDIVAEYSLHGFIPAAGPAVQWGRLCQQRVDARHRTVGVQAATDVLPPDERRALEAGAEAAALGLRQLGYFGPFGIDCYRYRDRAGRVRFNPVSELNARYTIGYAVGMLGKPHPFEGSSSPAQGEPT